jgi:DNA polymerase-3 subunit delta'
MNWKHVIGQGKIKQQLEHELKSNQVPHAQLFTGVSGYGSLPLALSFGLDLLGVKRFDEKETSLGKLIMQPDFHFVYPVVKKGTEKLVFSVDYAEEWSSFIDSSPYGNYSDWFDLIRVGNKQGLIGVNEIERLHKKMSLKAFGGGNKVCVLWGVEKMNKEAANTFLKLLEEPPKKTYFMLLAENGEELLPTISSRCQLISVGPILAEDLALSLPEDVMKSKQLVAQADGNFNRLQSLIKNLHNEEHEALLIQGVRTAFKAKGNKAVVVELMSWSDKLSVLGREEQKAFLIYAIQFFRDAFLLNYGLGQLVHYQSKNGFDLTKFAPFVHNENIQQLIMLFESSHYHILRNASAKMIFADLGIKLTRLLNLPGG